MTESLGLSLSVTSENSEHPLALLNKKRRIFRMSRIISNVLFQCNYEARQASDRRRCAFVTLTYNSATNWEPRHVTGLIDNYRKWGAARGFAIRGCWVMELHKSGRPHYHVCLFLPLGLTPPLPDKQGWWPHGMTNAKWIKNPSGYMAKYVSKWSTKENPYPKGARMYGCFGLSLEAKAIARWNALPAWLRKCANVGDVLKKRILGYWYNVTADFSARSPFVWVSGWLGRAGRIMMADPHEADYFPLDIFEEVSGFLSPYFDGSPCYVLKPDFFRVVNSSRVLREIKG